MNMIEVQGVSKAFHLHNQHQAVIPVLGQISLRVAAGECVALAGASGSGKSTLMRMVYGNYACHQGSIRVNGVEVAQADPHTVMGLRKHTMGYVSQFLRVLPRVPTLRVVAQPMLQAGASEAASMVQAQALLTRLRIPEALWSLSPLTFSGGEQQRVNIARSFCHPYPVLLLDEPTASLDAANRDTVIAMIQEAKQQGVAMMGIFHDLHAREALADRVVDLAQINAPEAA